MADSYDWLVQLIQKGLVKETDIPSMPGISDVMDISPDDSDNRPFPIRAELSDLSDSPWERQEACTIPWWLAEYAYLHYVALYGESQS